jgi:hypothetical protein
MQRFTTIQQQEDESLITFLTRFKHLIYEARATTWLDSSHLSTLHRGLRPSLHQTLEDTNDSLFSLSYDEYVELIQLINRRTHHAQPVKNPATKPAPTQTHHHDLIDTDPVRISHARVVKPVLYTPSTSSTRSSASATKRRSYQLEHDLCLYCGSDDH